MGQAQSSGRWLKRGGKDHREEKMRWKQKRQGGLQRFQSSGESNGSTWFLFELSVFCHAGESVSHKVMYNTLLITFWPPGFPHTPFPSPHPSPFISTFYPRGAETQASTQAPIQLGFLSPEAIAKASGNPWPTWWVRKPAWVAASRGPDFDNPALRKQKSYNLLFFFNTWGNLLEMWCNPIVTGDVWLISGADRSLACLNYRSHKAHLNIQVTLPRQLLLTKIK